MSPSKTACAECVNYSLRDGGGGGSLVGAATVEEDLYSGSGVPYKAPGRRPKIERYCSTYIAHFGADP
eukprot:1527901-Pyramimonas_sp.AAC.1